MTEERSLDEARRLGQLEHVHDVVTRLLATEQECPGSVDGLLVAALHSSVTSWCHLRGVRTS